jgi:hypothetical protein
MPLRGTCRVPGSSNVKALEITLQPPRDRNGNLVRVGARVRLLSLSGDWLDKLPAEEKPDVLSMIGEVFEIEEIDEYGHPWVRKTWPNEEEGTCQSHSIALESREMELIVEPTL